MNNLEIIDRLKAALTAAKEHLEWTGYGDSWERECARNCELASTIETALALEPKKD